MLKITLFGVPHTALGNQPLPKLSRLQTEHIWIYLLLHAEVPVPLSQLAAAFWPDAETATSRANLRRHLHMIGQWLPSPPAEVPWLIRNRDTVGWNPSAKAVVDVHEFEAYLRRASIGGEEGVGTPVRANLEHAVALFRDEVAASADAEWLKPIRQRLRSQLVHALERLWRLQASEGDLVAALGTAERLVALDPNRESVYQALMWVHAKLGDTQTALDCYDMCCLQLEHQFGLGPSQSTIGLAEAIRHREDLYSWTPWRADHAGSGTSDDFSVADQSQRMADNLPESYNAFIGRDQEIKQILKLLTVSRAITLTGVGGGGKTRLAQEAARAARQRFADGVWWVALEALNDPELIGRELARSLRLRLSSERPALEEVTRHLANQSALIVIDNCEHIAQGASDAIQSILEACPGVHVMATSRVKLSYLGEITWPVPPLSLPAKGAAGTGNDEVLTYEAVRLFVARVRDSWPEYALTPARLNAIGELCRQVEGIPLSIELAAARVGVLDVEEITVRLATSLRALRSLDRSHPDRHRTLTATIDWGYRLLSDPERSLLRRISVFAGNFTLRAAAAITNDENLKISSGADLDEVTELVGRLVDKSFVVIDASGERRRFRLLDMIRQFGRERLVEAGELDELERRHAEYYVALAEQVGPHLKDVDAEQWMNILDIEQGEIRMAMQRMQQHKEWIWAARLGGSIWRYWYVRGHIGRERHWMEEALDQLDGHSDMMIESKLRYGIAVLAYAQRDLPTARHFFASSLELLRQLDDKATLGRVFLNLGVIAVNEGHFAVAEENLNESVYLNQELGQTAMRTQATFMLAELARRRGDFSEAMAISRTVMNDGHATQDLGTAVTAGLQVMAAIAINQGTYIEARTLIDRWLTQSQLLRDKRDTANALHTQGMLLTEIGDFAGAIVALKAAMEHFRELDSEPAIAQELHNLGELELRRGNHVVARFYLNRSLELKEALQDTWNRTHTLLALAELEVHEGHVEAATPRADEALSLAQHFGAKSLIAHALRIRAKIALAGGNSAQAHAPLAESLALVHRIGQQRAIALALDLAADVASAEGDHDAACRFTGAADAVREAIGAPRTFAEQESHERCLIGAREVLGAESVAAIVAEAQAQARDAAVGDALAWLNGSDNTAPHSDELQEIPTTT